MSYFALLQNRLLPYAPLLAGLLIFFGCILWLLFPIQSLAQETPADPRPDWINRIILNLLWTIVVNVFGFWVTAGGFILNYGLGLYVVGFGDQYLGTNIGVAVDNLWVIIRDLFNLTFIFGLVYLGIRMILNSDDSNTKRNLIYLIMAALLVNFSLFITKFVIDFTNVTATQFLYSIETTGAPPFSVPNLSPAGGTYNVPDVAAAVATRMNLASFLSGGGPNFAEIATSAGYAYVIFTAIFLLIAGFVFLSGGLLLMIRFVALNFFMIFSPIMFLGWVFPNLQSITSRYWRGFLGRAFFAPIYVILIYIALTIMAGYTNGISTFSGGATGVGQMFGSDPDLPNVQAGFLGIAIPFVIISGFMLGALIIAQKLGADGANMAVSVGDNIRKRGQRALINGARNTAAYVPRNVTNKTGGMLSSGITNLQTLNAPVTGGGVKGWAARRIKNTAQLDVVDRNVRAASTAMSGAKFGLKNTVDDNTREYQQRRSAMESRTTISNGLVALNSAEEQNYQSILKRQKELDEIKKAGGTDQVVLADGVTVKDRSALTSDEQLALNNALGEVAQKRQAVIADMQSKINDLGVKDIEAMGQADREAIAGLLTTGQVESLMKSDNISAGDKKQIGIKRSNAFKSMITAVLGNQEVVISDKLQKLSAAQLEAIGIDFINKNAADLTDKQIEDLAKSKNFTETQIGQLKANRERVINQRFADSLVALPSQPGIAPRMVNTAFYETTSASVDTTTGKLTGNYTKKKKAAEIAKFPANVLKNKSSVPFLTVDILNEIVKNKTLTIEERNEMANNIISEITNKRTAGTALTNEEAALERMLINPSSSGSGGGPSQRIKDEFNL